MEQLTLIVENKAQEKRESNGPAVEVIQQSANISAKDIILDGVVRVRQRRYEAAIARHGEALRMRTKFRMLVDAADSTEKSVDVED